MNALFHRVTTTVVSLTLALATVSAAGGVEASRVHVAPELAATFAGSSPLVAGDLPAFEEHLRALSAAVTPAVVGIQAGAAGGSGVIVSADGIVLTAGHVISRPDQEVVVILPDGTRVAGRALGANRTFDSGMIRISEPGEWPHVELGRSADVAVGQWCISIGQPLGFDVRRRPPLRLGRVLRNDPHALQTDCTIVSGDSGGPLFDMAGRVIGIHSRIGTPLTDNVHVPVDDYRDDWEHLVAGEMWGRLFRRAGDPDAPYLGARAGRGEGAIIGRVTPNGPADRCGLREGDRVIAFGAVPIRTFSDLVVEIARRRPGDSVPVDVDRSGAVEVYDLVIGRRGDTALSTERRPGVESLTRGAAVREAFRASSASPARLVVLVAREGFAEPLARATAVDAVGLLATKASEIEGVRDDLEARFGDGAHVPAEVLHVDDVHDLALLWVEREVTPVAWVDEEPAVGSFVVSPGLGDELPRVGVVSSPARHVGRSRAFLGITLGGDGDGVLIGDVMADGAAEAAGMRKGDVIVAIGGDVITDADSLLGNLGRRSPGDPIEVVVRRDGRDLSFDVVLGERPAEEESRRARRLRGDVNDRRTDFPVALQHDTVLSPVECGGPTLGLDGRMIGINVARASRVESYAIPAAVVREVVTGQASVVRERWLGRIATRRESAEQELGVAQEEVRRRATRVELLSALEEAIRADDLERARLIESLLAEADRDG